MGRFVWDLRSYYWPRESVLRWWEQGWDWDNLRTKKCPHAKYPTYGDYYQPVFTFPKPGEQPVAEQVAAEAVAKTSATTAERGKAEEVVREMSEREYWGDERWLTEFPKGSGKRWTPYHLPLFDPATGLLSPKHPNYKGTDAWSDRDQEVLILGLRARMRAGAEVMFRFEQRLDNWKVFGDETRAPLSGCVVPPGADLSFPGEIVHVVFDCGLFAECCLSEPDDPEEGTRHTNFGNGTSFRAACFSGWARFWGAVFGGHADFDSAQFSGLADFESSEFGGDAYFSGTQFGDALFVEASFGYEAKFQDAQFLGVAYFGGSRFDEWAKFERSRFYSEAYFQGARFGYSTDFQQVQFCGTADFSLGSDGGDGTRDGTVKRPPTASLEIETDQQEIVFELHFERQHDMAVERAFPQVDFSGAEFWGSVNFQNRTFAETTDFSRVKFYAEPEFHGATLHSDTKFVDTMFNAAPGGMPNCPKREDDAKSWQEVQDFLTISRSYFCAIRRLVLEFEDTVGSVEFVGGPLVRLNNADWWCPRWYRHVILDQWDLKKIEALPQTLRERAKAAPLKGRADRRLNAQIEEIAALTVKLVRAIHVVSSERRLLFLALHLIAWSERKWFLDCWMLGKQRKDHKPPRNFVPQPLEVSRRNKIAADFEGAFRRLKLQMSQIGSRIDEQRFYAFELQSRRKRHDVPNFESAFGKLYEVLSDYGQSVTRPLIAVGSVGVIAGVFLCLLSGLSGQGYLSLEVVGFAGIYLLRNLLPVFLVRDISVSDAGGGTYHHWLGVILQSQENGLYVLATTHAILNLIFWFLFALALRRRFQIT